MEVINHLVVFITGLLGLCHSYEIDPNGYVAFCPCMGKLRMREKIPL